MERHHGLAFLVLAFGTSCGRFYFGNVGDAGDGSSAAGGDGGDGDSSIAPTLPCGTTVLLADDFDDGVSSSAWQVFNDGGYTVAEIGGALSVTYGASVSATRYGGYSQKASMDIVGACVIVELLQAPAVLTDAYAYARIGTSSKKISWLVQAGTLSARESAVADVTIGQLPFDPVKHRFLRIREISGNFECDTAPAREGPYTPFGLIGVSTVSLTSATVELGAATDLNQVTNGGTVAWGDVLVTKP